MASQPGEALAAAVRLMDRFGLLGMVIPEVGTFRAAATGRVAPEGDAWEHTLAALRASTFSDPAVNLAVLLHDVGKSLRTGRNGGGTATGDTMARGRPRRGRRAAPVPAAADARGDRVRRRAPHAGRAPRRAAAVETAGAGR